MTPDTELFKVIVNGGSFAMLVLLFCWALFRLEPRIREMMERKDALHTAQVENLVRAFMEAQTKKDVECHAERKEWKDTILREMETNREAISREMDLNRKSRHDLANQIQRMFVEAFNEAIGRRLEDRNPETE